ncbi:hypothetical protein [Paenibacillus chitinolyticus]
MQNLLDSILRYVKKEKTNYAILLAGKWGSGKSYFWENVIKHKIEEIVINGRKQRVIYISLYGVNTIDEINKKIFIDNLLNKNQFFKKTIENKWGGRITELTKMAVGAVKSFDIPIISDLSSEKVKFENLIDFTDTVLCFDDLERSNLEITNVLGYINNYVERDGIKAILIGNEEEISERILQENIELKILVSSILLDKEGGLNKTFNAQLPKGDTKNVLDLLNEKKYELFNKTNEYNRIKEKLIAKTFTFQMDHRSVIESLSSQYPNDLSTFLLNNQSIIEYLFKQSGKDNIRILKHGLDDFELIYMNITEMYPSLNTEIITSILKFTLVASFEIKSGSLGYDKLKKLSSNDDLISILTISHMTKKPEDKDTYIESIINKYYSGERNQKYQYFYKFVETLVSDGIFNKLLFTQEVDTLLQRIKVDLTPEYIKFLHRDYWQRLTDEEFEVLKEQTYTKLIQGEVSFVSYFRAFILYRYFIEKKLLNKSEEELANELMNGLSKAVKTGEYYDHIDSYFLGVDIQANDKHLMDIKKEILKHNQSLLDQKFESKVQVLFEYLPDHFPQFMNELVNEFYYVPVFKYCKNIDPFIKTVMNLLPIEIVELNRQLKKRYQTAGLGSKLFLDYDNLLLIEATIESFVKNKKPTIKISTLHDFIDTIHSICSHLKNRLNTTD